MHIYVVVYSKGQFLRKTLTTSLATINMAMMRTKLKLQARAQC